MDDPEQRLSKVEHRQEYREVVIHVSDESVDDVCVRIAGNTCIENREAAIDLRISPRVEKIPWRSPITCEQVLFSFGLRSLYHVVSQQHNNKKRQIMLVPEISEVLLRPK